MKNWITSAALAGAALAFAAPAATAQMPLDTTVATVGYGRYSRPSCGPSYYAPRNSYYYQQPRYRYQAPSYRYGQNSGYRYSYPSPRRCAPRYHY